MTSRRKIKLPTMKQLEKALPFVSAGLSILSSLPFKNKKVAQTLAVAASATGQSPAGDPSHTAVVRNALRTALDDLAAAKPQNTTPERIAELTTRALTLARILVTND